jgi:hypothetical protein
MENQESSTTVYCGYYIAINPSNKPDEVLTDAFLILEPSTNPMFTATLYEHPGDAVKTYATQDEARQAALQLAREWIDKYLSQRSAAVAAEDDTPNS